MTAVRIDLVGDQDSGVAAHRAIPLALAHAGGALGVTVNARWRPTESLREAGAVQAGQPHGLWCVPASPYRSEQGALNAIQFARESGLPFLGTCGGFQHALLEYARHVAGLPEAAHAENDPGAADPLIVPLSCELVEKAGTVRFEPGSRIARAYGMPAATETYHCRFGLARRFVELLEIGPLRVSARDDAGEVRAVEIERHRFFVATLFQPERSGLAGHSHPLITEFVRSAIP